MTAVTTTGEDGKPTMEDTIREAYRAMGKPDVGGDEPANEPANETETPGDLGESSDALNADGTPRDEKGRFAAKAKAEAKKDTKAPEGEEPTEEEIAAVEAELLAQEGGKPAAKPAEKTATPPATDGALEKAPSSWRGDAQQLWKDVPPAVKAEIYRREENFHRGLEGYRQMADIGNVLHTEIAPYEAMIRASGETPQSLVRDYFNTAYILKTGTPDEKAKMLFEIARNNGIDLDSAKAVSDAFVAGQPTVDPAVAALAEENRQIKQRLEAQDHDRARQEYAAIHGEVQAFGKTTDANGQLKYPHFEAVRAQMATLFESGQAKTYEEAYNSAIWSHPEVRQTLLAQQQAADRRQRAEKAARAKKAAAVNVAKRGTPPTTEPVGTMDDTIRKTYRKLIGRE